MLGTLYNSIPSFPHSTAPLPPPPRRRPQESAPLVHIFCLTGHKWSIAQHI